MTITFEHPTLIFGRSNSYHDGCYEADLVEPSNPDQNAELTIFMSVYFYDGYNDPAIATNGIAKDSDGNRFPVVRWPDKLFHAWKTKLLQQARRFWNGKFWLLTPPTYRGLDLRQPKVRPNIWCRFELTESLTKQGSNFAIAAVNLGSHPTRTNFRSHLLLYDSADPLATKKHEVGHLLGLDHPGGRNNTAAAYVDRPGHPGDIMGAGRRIYAHHALPWQRAIAFITNTKAKDWNATLVRVAPKKIT